MSNYLDGVIIAQAATGCKRNSFVIKLCKDYLLVHNLAVGCIIYKITLFVYNRVKEE